MHLIGDLIDEKTVSSVNSSTVTKLMPDKIKHFYFFQPKS